MLRPFVPVTRGRQQPAAHRVHGRRSDPDNYGELRRLRDAARATCPTGPASSRADISADEDVSRAARPARQRGLRASCRQPALVPIDEPLLYVRPFYVEADERDRQLPQLTGDRRRSATRWSSRTRSGGARRRCSASRPPPRSSPTPSPTRARRTPGDGRRRRRSRARAAPPPSRPASLLDEADELSPRPTPRSPERRPGRPTRSTIDEAQAKVDEADDLLRATPPTHPRRRQHHDQRLTTAARRRRPREPGPELESPAGGAMLCAPTPTRGGAVW